MKYGIVLTIAVADLTDGCRERVNLDFLKWVLAIYRKRRPGLLATPAPPAFGIDFGRLDHALKLPGKLELDVGAYANNDGWGLKGIGVARPWEHVGLYVDGGMDKGWNNEAPIWGMSGGVKFSW